DVSIVVFPEDSTKWAYPSRYVQSTRTGTDGRFSIQVLPRIDTTASPPLSTSNTELSRGAGQTPPPNEAEAQVTALRAGPLRPRGAGTGGRRRLERHDVHRIGVVRVDDDGKSEVRRQSFGDRSPRVAVVVAPQHADVRPRPAGPGPIRPPAVVLDVEPAGRVVVPRDLVHALTELGIGIGCEAGADALIGRPERFAAVLAQIVAAGRDAEVHAAPVANDRVHAEPAVAGLPLARVRMVADGGHHVPRIAAVTAPEQGRRLHAAPQFLFAAAGLERPDVDERASVLLGECRRRLRFLEALPHVRRAQHLH